MIRVVGHTDSQPISNPATRQRFANNRVLSVFRAIAVSEALQMRASLATVSRSLVGPHRPAVANNPTGGTAANRRVEIFVVPMGDMPVGETSSDWGRLIPAETAPASAQDFPIK